MLFKQENRLEIKPSLVVIEVTYFFSFYMKENRFTFRRFLSLPFSVVRVITQLRSIENWERIKRWVLGTKEGTSPEDFLWLMVSSKTRLICVKIFLKSSFFFYIWSQLLLALPYHLIHIILYGNRILFSKVEVEQNWLARFEVNNGCEIILKKNQKKR